MRKVTFLLSVIMLLTCFTGTSFGKGLGLKAVAPQLGIIFPEDPFSTGFNIGAVANLGEFYENIGLYPGLLFWSAGGEQSGVDVSFTNFQIAGDVHYYTEDLEGFFAGLGLSLNFLSSKAEYFNPLTSQTESYSSSDTKVGFALFVGYEMPIDKYTGYVKGKYEIISDFSTFKIDFGLYFDVGN